MQPPGNRTKPGFHVGQHLNHIRAQSARTVFPGMFRKQRNHIEIDAPLPLQKYIEFRVSVRFIRMEHGTDLLPLGRQLLQVNSIEQSTAPGIKFDAHGG